MEIQGSIKKPTDSLYEQCERVVATTNIKRKNYCYKNSLSSFTPWNLKINQAITMKLQNIGIPNKNIEHIPKQKPVSQNSIQMGGGGQFKQ